MSTSATLAALQLADSASGPGTGPDLTRYLLICAGMVATVVLLGWLLQRTVSGAVRGRAAKRALRVIDLLPLGGKKRLAVVRVYDRTFVLGLGDKEVSVVSELDGAVQGALELQPAPSLGKNQIARAFEKIRARVEEGRPKPQPQQVAQEAARPKVKRRGVNRRLGGGQGILG